MREGALTSSQLVRDCLERIERREPEVGAWEHLDAVGARRQAVRADVSGPAGLLHGVPVAVKDIIDVAGLPVRCGTPIRIGRMATTDATCVRLLRASGAIVLGKTVTTEFAYFSPGKTRNPHALEHTPGGSSSGSAAAVADTMVPCALGTQTAGSTVRPASFCGIAGFVPTYGALPIDGTQHLAPLLDRLGLLARTVDDLVPLYQVLSGIAHPSPLRPPARVLVTDGSELADVHPAMRATVRRVADTLTGLGVPVAPLDAADLMRRCAAAQQVVMAYDAARTLADVVAEHRRELSAPLLELLDAGAATPEASFREALATADAAHEELAPTLGADVVILAPGAVGPAPRGIRATGDPAMSRPWHLLGLPAVALPAGDVDGLPLGVQLVGARDTDGSLLAAARWLATHLR
ncbi:MAG: amidase [Streptosporangiales bacterium]|nr:amidase [Streptosporangiales bacterium]